MENQRETAEVTLPKSGVKVVMLTYLTGREKRMIEDEIAGGKLQIDAKTQKVSGFDKGMIHRMGDALMKALIVSIDGHKQDEEVDGKKFSIIEYVLDLRSADYDYIGEVLQKVYEDEDFLGDSTTSRTNTPNSQEA